MLVSSRSHFLSISLAILSFIFDIRLISLQFPSLHIQNFCSPCCIVCILFGPPPQHIATIYRFILYSKMEQPFIQFYKFLYFTNFSFIIRAWIQPHKYSFCSYTFNGTCDKKWTEKRKRKRRMNMEKNTHTIYWMAWVQERHQIHNVPLKCPIIRWTWINFKYMNTLYTIQN